MMFGSRDTNLCVRASDSPENMRIVDRPININAMARKIDVDNGIPLRKYYRIADNLLKQASIYREERNIIDLYVILLRYTSLVSETIPYHRDYNAMFPKEKIFYKKRLVNVIDELESLKPDVQRSVAELNKARMRAQRGSPERISYNSASSSFVSPPYNQKQISSNLYAKELHPASRSTSQSSLARGNEYNQIVKSNNVKIEKQLQKLSFSVPPPKEETLSRHSILGPNGLRGHWLGPSTAIKVHYPSNADLTPIESPRLHQDEQNDVVTVKDGDPGGNKSAMELVLDLDDGRWSSSAEELCSDDYKRKELVEVNNIRQPSPPPVLAQVNQDYAPICPSKVADPRPGPANSSQDDSFTSYQHLHIPISMLEGFLRLAKTNTTKNLETCGVLAGSLKNRIFHITTLIIPKQESTSDSFEVFVNVTQCQTTNEEEIFDVQDKLSLLPLGWIHTHPSQTCFMSSVDLHTHYSYQIMLPEAIAIVMAPTDKTRPHGIFHLSDPGGVSVIRKCQQRGFHPHEEPADGSPIYEHCSHVFMNPNLKFEVIDLR